MFQVKCVYYLYIIQDINIIVYYDLHLSHSKDWITVPTMRSTSFFLTGVLSFLLLPFSSFAQGVAAPSSSSSASVHASQQIVINQQSGVEVRGDFQVGPTRFVLEMNPGEERSVELSVTSREGEPRSYDISVEDFAVSSEDNDNIQFYGKGDGPFSAKSWVTPVASSFTLRHGERATIPVRVSVPANAAVGDHYSVVLFERTIKDTTKGGFNMVPRVGALLLITVKGDVIHQGTLQMFRSASFLYWALPARFRVQYKNSGTVHMVPTGHIEMKNIFGITVDDIPVRDWYVLRNSTRRREVLWQPHFALGRYSATLSLNADGQEVTTPLTVQFWVIPTLPVLLSLLAIFGVSFLVQMFFGRYELKKKS